MLSATPTPTDPPSSASSLRPVMLFGAVVAASMGVALVLAFMHGRFFADAGAMLDLVWGRFSLFELYIGFTPVAAWILARESHRGRALLWIASLMLFGHVISGLYIAWAAYRSGGDKRKFWLGV